MAVDITTLGIQIDLLNGAEAVQILDKLTAAATRAGNAGHGLSQRSQAASGSINTLQNTANSASSALSQATQRLLGFNTATGNLNSVSRSASASMNRMEDSAKNLANSLQQAAKSALAYFAAYKSITGLDKLISDGFAYNEQIEKAQLGIAAVIASTMDLVDAQGQVLKAQEKFNAAQKMSVEMAKALDVASMQSPAGYTHLLSTFQAMLAPANQLGLKWQDTLDITIKMSNVLSALGLDMERLGAETQAILTGKRISQSAVAQRLGITKEEIQSWKTGIELMDKFQERFEAFKYAGVAVEDTMEAVREYYEDVIKNASGDAFTSLWTSAKEAMLEVADAFYVIDEETQKFRKTEEWEALSQVIDGISSAIGEGFVSAVKSGVDAFKSLGSYINKVGTDEFLSDMGSKAQIASFGLLALVAARKAATAEFVIANGVEQQRVTGLGNYVTALGKSQAALVSERNAAKKALDIARQELQGYQRVLPAIQAYNERTLGSVSLAQARAQSQAHLTQLINAATAAEQRYAAAVQASSIATKAANALKAAGMGLINMFGGPLGIALTAVTVGVTAYMTSASKASEATKTLEKAQESWSAVMRQCVDENGKLKEELSSTQKMMLELAQEDALKAWKTNLKAITDELQKVALTREQIDMMSETSLLTTSFGDIVPQSVVDHLNGLLKMLKDEGPSATQKFIDSLSDLRNWLKESGYANTELAQKIAELASEAQRSETGLLAMAQKLGIVSDSANNAAVSIQSMKNAMAGGWNIDTQAATSFIGKMEDEIRDLQLKRENITGKMADLGKLLPEKSAKEIGTLLKTYRDKGIGEFVKQVDKYAEMTSEQQINIVSSFDAAARLQAEQLLTKTWEDGQRKTRQAAKSATLSQADYTGELERTQNAVASLEKQLGLSKAETLTQAKIKAEQQYQDTISKTNEQLAKQVARGSLTQAQAEALRTEKEKQASLQKQLAIKQAEQKQDQKNVQIAQGQIKFYKELGQLSGNYTDTVELQNLLLQKQAEEYVKTYGISQDLVDQWLYFQQLQISTDPFDGAYRGLLKFESEYGDSAKQWESVTYNFGKNFMSTTRDMFDDFLETGKASFDGFKDLFKKFLKDLAWYALAQPVMLSIVGGVTGAISGTGAVQTGTQVGTAAAGSGNVAGQLTNGVSSLVQSQLTSKLFGSGSGGIMGGITSGINSAVAEMFPSMFVSSEQAVINSALNEAHSLAYGTAGNFSTTTFTSALATPALGAGIGAMASPFVNSLLGLENNTGSQVGSLVGGGLGTLGGAALTAAFAATPGIGWIAGGIAALGSLLGGGVGSLFGGGKQEKPELYIHTGANLWEKSDKLSQINAGGAALFTNGPADSATASFARAVGDQGTNYSTAQTVSEYLSGLINAGQEMSFAIAETLGNLDKSLESQYLKNIKEKGRILGGLYLEGDDINQGRIESYGEAVVSQMQEAMLDSLSRLDLKPLVKAADGYFADTGKELAQAFNNVISYANLGASIDDEELKAKFSENVIPQITGALNQLSLQSLTRTAKGYAAMTLDELSTAFNDVFAVYDLGESIEDENIRKAFQDWAQKAIESAFTSTNFNLLRVDFDQKSFAGLQQAYAAIQAWQQVDQTIEAVINPTTEFTSQLTAASNEFDTWIENLRALGWREEAVMEVEAKRTDYMRKLASSISEEFDAFMNPVGTFTSQLKAAEEQFDDWIGNLRRLGYSEEEITEIEARRSEYLHKQAYTLSADFKAFMDPVSDFDQAMSSAAEQFDEWVANLGRLGYAEEEIIAIEAKRAAYLEDLAASMERATAQDLTSRITSLRYGSNSNQYAIQSLLVSQRNELESLKSQFGENHYLYQTAIGVQGAELVSTILSQLKDQQQALLEQEKQEEQKRLTNERTALQERQSAIKSEISAAQSLANTFKKLVRTLEEYRRDLWSGDDNLTGSRYSDAYYQFNALYEKALAGDEDAFNEITGKASELLELGREQLPERGEYNDLFYNVDQKLKQLQLVAERESNAASAQEGLLNQQLAALERQQDTLNSQLDAINENTAAVNEIPYSIDELSAAILAMEELFDAQMASLVNSLKGQEDAAQKKLDTLEAQAAYANSIAFEDRTDWDAQSTLERILEGFDSFEQWYDLYGKNQGGLVAPYDTNQARENIVANKVDQLNKTAYQGRTNWTAEDFYKAIGGNTAANIDAWYKNYGMSEGITAVRDVTADGLAGTIDAILKGDYSLLTQQKTGTSLLDTAIGDLESLNKGYWPQVLSGLSSTGAMFDSSIANVVNAVTGLGGTFGSEIEKLLASMNISGSSGSSSTSSATSIPISTPSTSSSSGASIDPSSVISSAYDVAVLKKWQDVNKQNTAGRNDWSLEEVKTMLTNAWGTIEGWYENEGKKEGYTTTLDRPINLAPGYGSNQASQTYTSAASGAKPSSQAAVDAAVLKKWQMVNDANTGGRSDWSLEEVKTMIINANGSLENWYETKGKPAGLARGGISPANEPFWVGENGPELMMSAQRWGVVNSEASRALMNEKFYSSMMQDKRYYPTKDQLQLTTQIVSQENSFINKAIQELENFGQVARASIQNAITTPRNTPHITSNREVLSALSLIASYVRQLLEKADKTAWNTGKSRETLEKWDKDGLPAEIEAYETSGSLGWDGDAEFIEEEVA